MYVSYLLDKEGPAMYPPGSSVRHAAGLNLAAQNFVPGPPYADYGAYHVGPAAAAMGLDNAGQAASSPGSPWPSPPPGAYDWNGYGHGQAAGLAYNPVTGDYHPHPTHPPPPGGPSCGGLAPSSAGLLHSLNAAPLQPTPEQLSPGGGLGGGGGGGQRRSLCEWMRKPTSGGPVKTRTKDKYRVVYTDHQRLELEKEFHYSRYITIRRKAELAATLGLSERQVKIWFQNRRAKERKINKKKMQQSQAAGVHSGSEPMSPVSSMQTGTNGPVVPNGGVLGTTGLVSPPTAQ
ncbi:homeobox protein CDX-2 [Anolis sagrei]|uniref:homeobox protein CDX-2 n=1 Tax=Anolis sagrei TaxID=38937 RepID=UPI003520B73F